MYNSSRSDNFPILKYVEDIDVYIAFKEDIVTFKKNVSLHTVAVIK